MQFIQETTADLLGGGGPLTVFSPEMMGLVELIDRCLSNQCIQELECVSEGLSDEPVGH